MCKHTYKTRYTLIQRACNLDEEEAWQQLYDHYYGFIVYLLQNTGVPSDAIDDVSQQVLIDLTVKLKQYDPEKGQFRSWFSTLVRNRGRMALRKAMTYQKYLDKKEDLDQAASTFENNDIETLIQSEWDNYLLKTVIEIVKGKLSETSFNILLLDLQGVPSEEIAEQLGIKVKSLYVFRQRVKQTIRKEVEALRENLEF